MLHLQFSTDPRIADKITKLIEKAKNWSEVKKILKGHGINPNLANRIFATAFKAAPLPNEKAFAMMKEFKKRHTAFDLGKDQYIKLTREKTKITEQITALKSIKDRSEGWVTFKFGCDATNKKFNVFIGHAYRLKNDTEWKYSAITDSTEISNFGKYYNSLGDTNKKITQGIAFKVFSLTVPLTNEEKTESIETWLGLNQGGGDFYIYPGYSAYTTLVLSNDDSLNTKVNNTDGPTLYALSFDYGSSCCPPE